MFVITVAALDVPPLELLPHLDRHLGADVLRHPVQHLGARHRAAARLEPRPARPGRSRSSSRRARCRTRSSRWTATTRSTTAPHDKHTAIVESYSHLFPPAIASIADDGIGILLVVDGADPADPEGARIFSCFWIVSIIISVVTLHPIILSATNPPGVKSNAPGWPRRSRGLTLARGRAPRVFGRGAPATRSDLHPPRRRRVRGRSSGMPSTGWHDADLPRAHRVDRSRPARAGGAGPASRSPSRSSSSARSSAGA